MSPLPLAPLSNARGSSLPVSRAELAVCVGLGPNQQGESRVRLVGASTQPSETFDVIKAVKDLWDADNPIRPIPLRRRRVDPLLAEILAMVGDVDVEDAAAVDILDGR